LVDLDHGLAVLVDGRTARAGRLANEYQVSTTPSGRGAVYAEFEAPGLFTGLHGPER
jgi:hypothetical protein